MLSVVMLNVIMPNVANNPFILSAVMLHVIMLSVMAPNIMTLPILLILIKALLLSLNRLECNNNLENFLASWDSQGIIFSCP